MDDRAMLLRMHKGHEPSARLLWERHAPAMLALAGAIVRDRAVAAEDVVQSAFCRVLDADRRMIRDIRDVRAWLCQVTRRVALNDIRAHRREQARRRHASRAHQEPRIGHDGLSDAVMALPRRYREVVVLKHAAGLTFDQISLALDIPRSTASDRYQAAINQLRSRLEGPPVPQEMAHG